MIEVWQWVTTTFNNREIAGAIWLISTLGLLLLKRDIRSGVLDVLKLASDTKLLVLFSSLAIWVVLVASLANAFGVWTSGEVAPTVVWYFLGGLPLLGRAFDAKEGSQHFRGYAKDALSGTALLEFVYVAGTFSLPIELILTPVVTLVGLMIIVSERRPEHASVNNLLTGLAAIFVLAIFWNSVSQIWNQPSEFFNSTTARNFILPIYLTVLSIPLFYFWHCYSHIEGDLLP